MDCNIHCSAGCVHSILQGVASKDTLDKASSHRDVDDLSFFTIRPPVAMQHPARRCTGSFKGQHGCIVRKEAPAGQSMPYQWCIRFPQIQSTPAAHLRSGRCSQAKRILQQSIIPAPTGCQQCSIVSDDDWCLRCLEMADMALQPTQKAYSTCIRPLSMPACVVPTMYMGSQACILN